MGWSMGRGVHDFKLEFDHDKKAVGKQRSPVDEDREDNTDS